MRGEIAPRRHSRVGNPSGLVVGGRDGGPETELLEDGQEEVFSRTEVETGRVEHKAEAGSGEEAPGPFGRPHP